MSGEKEKSQLIEARLLSSGENSVKRVRTIFVEIFSKTRHNVNH